MNILITGAFGFVGNNISRSLKLTSKNNLIAVDIRNIEQNVYNEYYSWNDLNMINWNQIDTIIHLAGKAHDTNNTSDSLSYFDINLGLTNKIFTYFLKAKANKFIFFSSVKAVTDVVQQNILTEEVIPDPKTPYGLSKYEAEQYLLSHYIPNKKVFIFRPCMIHGPGNKGNLNLLYKIVSKGLPWPLGAYVNERSFTSIDNLTFIIKQIIEKDIEPGIYNVADDEPISTNRIIELIAQSKGKKAKILKISPSFIKTISKIGDKIPFPLNSERLRKLTESYVVSNKKLKETLGIDKMPVSAEEGMKKTLSTF